MPRSTVRPLAGSLLVALLTAPLGCSLAFAPDEFEGGGAGFSQGGMGGAGGQPGGNPTAGGGGASGASAGGASLGGAGGDASTGGANGGKSGVAGSSSGAGGAICWAIAGTSGGASAGASCGLGGQPSAGEGGQPAGGATGTSGAGGQLPGGASGAGGVGGQPTGGAAGSAGSGGQPSSPTGAIVLAGTASAKADASVLVVLDPSTGQERSRESMVVAAIAHDAGDDRWFIFESAGSAEPTPSDLLSMHVRTLDLATGAWTELALLKNVPPLVIGTVVVLHDRLAYLGYADNTGGTRRVVLVDTSPGNYGLLPMTGAGETYTTSSAAGLIGFRNGSSVGGTLDVVGVAAAPCTSGGGAAGSCDVTLRPITVDTSGAMPFAAKTALSFPYAVGAQPTWTTSTTNNEVLLAAPAKADQKPYLRRFSPAGVSALGQPMPFDASGSTFRSMAFDDCSGLAFLTELNADQAVFAIPTKTVASAGVQSLGRPGQRVLYEPTTHSAIVPFSQGGMHSLRAFTVDATASPPTMTERLAPAWAPPDIAPGAIAVRQPPGGGCKN